MNVETKSVREDYNVYKFFGWQHTEDTKERHGKFTRTYHILVRDKEMANYGELCKLEKDYFSLKATLRPQVEIDGATFLLLLLLFVIPGILYLVFKFKKKNEINEYNYYVNQKMLKVLELAKQLQ